MGCRVATLLVLNSSGGRVTPTVLMMAKMFNNAVSLRRYWQHVASPLGEASLDRDTPAPSGSRKMSGRLKPPLPTPRQREISLAEKQRQR